MLLFHYNKSSTCTGTSICYFDSTSCMQLEKKLDDDMCTTNVKLNQYFILGNGLKDRVHD